jgi:predicted acetyltransferase
VSISIRHATAADRDAIIALDSASFGTGWSPEQYADALSVLDIERFLVAVDGERVVGIAADAPLDMTVPGGELPVRGVTWVGVDVTHRRRGVLTGLMRTQLGEYRDEGIPAAILCASESGIYGRFGYGAASYLRKTEIHRRRATLRTPGDASNVTRVSADEARKRMPEIHDRWRAGTPGAITRSEAMWDLITLDKEHDRDGMSNLYYLLHDDGYVTYRIKSEWSDGDPRHLCWIADYFPVTAEAHRDLWQVLLSHDLVGTICSYQIPLDDPLPHLLTDARQVRTTHVGDGVWVRPLDVTAMLTARRYAVDVDVVLDVHDELFGDQRLRLTAGPDGVDCTATQASADVTLDVSTLGALYLGGVRLWPLAAAGRVDVADDATLSRLDRALLADRAPKHGTNI